MVGVHLIWWDFHVFPRWFYILHSYQQWMRVPVTPHPSQHVVYQIWISVVLLGDDLDFIPWIINPILSQNTLHAYRYDSSAFRHGFQMIQSSHWDFYWAPDIRQGSLCSCIFSYYLCFPLWWFDKRLGLLTLKKNIYSH